MSKRRRLQEHEAVAALDAAAAIGQLQHLPEAALRLLAGKDRNDEKELNKSLKNALKML